MEWKGKIISAVANDLPGLKSHNIMLPSGRSLMLQPEEIKSVKKSSIMVLLFLKETEIFTCLIKRPSHMKYHPGQVGFPGGMVDSSDNSMIETALRETKEELGIETSTIDILGTLSELYISVSGFLIYPILGWSNRKPETKINPLEVEKVIWFPLFQNINRKDSAVVETSTGQMIVPCILYEGEIIWGATAMILAELFDIMRGITNG